MTGNDILGKKVKTDTHRVVFAYYAILLSRCSTWELKWMTAPIIYYVEAGTRDDMWRNFNRSTQKKYLLSHRWFTHLHSASVNGRLICVGVRRTKCLIWNVKIDLEIACLLFCFMLSTFKEKASLVGPMTSCQKQCVSRRPVGRPKNSARISGQMTRVWNWASVVSKRLLESREKGTVIQII